MLPPFPLLTSNWHDATYPGIDPNQSRLSVVGKTVIITGGGRGIGSRIGHAFAKAGASVIAITGRTESSLQSTKASIQAESPKTKILTFAADATDEPTVNAAFGAVKDASENKLGIDILVLNAGYFQDATPIAPSPSASAAESSATVKEWWKGFETNVFGSYITTRAFLNNMRPKSGSNPSEPVLIGVSTNATCFFPPPPKLSGYVTSKVASAQFLQIVAAENPEVRVMNFHPGVIETEMDKKGLDTGLESPVDDMVDADGHNFLLVELPAHFTVWLASKDAEFLKNKMVWCNWDIEELKAKKERITADPAFLNIGMNGWPYQA